MLIFSGNNESLRLEFRKVRILEILNFRPCAWQYLTRKKTEYENHTLTYATKRKKDWKIDKQNTYNRLKSGYIYNLLLTALYVDLRHVYKIFKISS